MKKVFIIIVLALMILPFVTAQQQSLGSVQSGQDVDLIQICGNCTFNNVTSIISPNGTINTLNSLMTRDGTLYNLTYAGGNVIPLGQYIVNGVGDLNGNEEIWSYDFQVTRSGADKINQGEGFVLLGIFLVLIFGIIFFLIATIFINNIPFKIFLGALSVLMLVGTVGFGVTIMQQMFGTFANVVASFTLFYRMLIFLLMAAGTGLILFLVAFAVRSFNKSRGLID